MTVQPQRTDLYQLVCPTCAQPAPLPGNPGNGVEAIKALRNALYRIARHGDLYSRTVAIEALREARTYPHFLWAEQRILPGESA